MDKGKILSEINSVLEEAYTIHKREKELEEKLVELCPIKKGDKVEIINVETDAHIRFAFVRDIKIGYVQNQGIICWVMDKCKKDGTKSNHNDYLGYKEAVKRIS
jgi:hypothetical protein